MINNYQLSFTKHTDDLSLEFKDQLHLIAYKNQLKHMDFQGRVIFDNDCFETYIISKRRRAAVDINEDIRQKFTI